MNWNQPSCAICYAHLHPGREPVLLAEFARRPERCAWCGQTTLSGIYVRSDPRLVAYPAADDDD
jgi:hypothetical protein